MASTLCIIKHKLKKKLNTFAMEEPKLYMINAKI